MTWRIRVGRTDGRGTFYGPRFTTVVSHYPFRRKRANGAALACNILQQVIERFMSGASMEGISAPTKWQLGGQHAGIVRGHLPKLLLSPKKWWDFRDSSPPFSRPHTKVTSDYNLYYVDYSHKAFLQSNDCTFSNGIAPTFSIRISHMECEGRRVRNEVLESRPGEGGGVPGLDKVRSCLRERASELGPENWRDVSYVTWTIEGRWISYMAASSCPHGWSGQVKESALCAMSQLHWTVGAASHYPPYCL